MSNAARLSTMAGIIATAMGETVTHTAADGTATEITDATFCEQEPEIHDGLDGKTTVRRAGCTIPAARVAVPARGETVTHGTTVWTIDQNPLAVGGGEYWQLALKRTEPIERTRQGHRTPR